MRKKNWGGKYKVWIILAIAILIVWGVIIWQLFANQKTNEDVLLSLELKRFEEKIDATLLTYESFSNYIFDQLEQDEELLSIIHQANTATEAEKDVLRERLYDKLSTQYKNMEKYQFRQFHFHLPNTESFLRVHKPDLHGDLLADIRESVKLSNETGERIKGFEEGKIYNGFRYVYPLEYESEHIGTVEISLSSASIIEVLEDLYQAEDLYFILDKEAIEGQVFEEELINYRETDEFKGYCVDEAVEVVLSSYNSIIPNKERKEFFQQLDDQFRGKIAEKESFSAVYTYQGIDYIIKFSSIENLKKQPIAYMISITENMQYENMARNTKMQILLVTILAFLIIVFSLVFFLYQYKLRDTIELDYLTKIYNRKKFYEIIETESRRNKHYKSNSSIMMLDIDHFKKINDTYGHAWGDKVLVELASQITQNIRCTDVFVRWGGEEFIVLLPETGKEAAIHVAEKIRTLIDDATSKELKDVTISVGVTKIDCDTADIDDAIKRADEAMYYAKKSGRNQVCFKV